jgi:hypothetical protein
MTMTPVEMFVRIVSMNRLLLRSSSKVPEFVAGLVIEPDVQIPGSHLLGPFRQHLDGYGYLPREIDSHPGGGEYHKEGDEDERGDVAGSDRVVEKPHLVVLVVRFRDLPDPRYLAGRDRLQRNDGPPVGQKTDGGHIRLADERQRASAPEVALQPFQAGSDLRGDLPGNVPAPPQDTAFSHDQESNVRGFPPPDGLQGGVEGDRLPLPEECGRRLLRQACQAPGLLLEVPAGDVERAGQGEPDPAADPRLDARRGDVGGRDEEEDRGNEGKGDEDEHQAGPDLRPQDVPLPVHDQLEHVPGDEEDQQDDQDDVDVDEGEDDDVARERHRPADRRQVRLQDGEPDHQGGHEPDGDPIPPSLCEPFLRGKIRLPAQILFHGAEMSPLAHSVSTSQREEKKRIERSGSDRPTLSRRVRTYARYLFPRVTS